MAEVTDHLYMDIQRYIQDKIKFIVLKDDNDKKIRRINISDESKVKWIHKTVEKEVDSDRSGNPIKKEVPANDKLTLQVVMKGDDAKITDDLPLTFAKSVIERENQYIYSEESFEPFTMEKAEDKLTVEHTIEIPKAK